MSLGDTRGLALLQGEYRGVGLLLVGCQGGLLRSGGASKGRATIHKGGLPGWGRTVHLNDKSTFISWLRDDVGLCGCMLKPAMGNHTS